MSSPRPPEAERVFAALGDRTRLGLMQTLATGPRSISELTADGPLTRQAVTKHLRVLEDAGLVTSRRVGRESRFALRPEAFRTVDTYLAAVRAGWQDSLARLKGRVESRNDG